MPSDYRYQDDGRMSSALLAQLCKMVVVMISPRSILSNDYHCCGGGVKNHKRMKIAASGAYVSSV